MIYVMDSEAMVMTWLFASDWPHSQPINRATRQKSPGGRNHLYGLTGSSGATRPRDLLCSEGFGSQSQARLCPRKRWCIHHQVPPNHLTPSLFRPFTGQYEKLQMPVTPGNVSETGYRQGIRWPRLSVTSVQELIQRA